MTVFSMADKAKESSSLLQQCRTWTGRLKQATDVLCTHQPAWPTWSFKANTPKMYIMNSQSLSASGSKKGPFQGSERINQSVEGARNTLVGLGCHTTLNIATYNAKSMSTTDKIDKINRTIPATEE